MREPLPLAAERMAEGGRYLRGDGAIVSGGVVGRPRLRPGSATWGSSVMRPVIEIRVPRPRAAVLAIVVSIVLLAAGCAATPTPTPSPTPSTNGWHQVFSVTNHFIVLNDVPTPAFRLAKGRVRVVATMFGSAPPGSGLEFTVFLARAGGRRPWTYFPMPTNPATANGWTLDLQLPRAVPAGRYVLMVSGDGSSYEAAVFQR